MNKSVEEFNKLKSRIGQEHFADKQLDTMIELLVSIFSASIDYESYKIIKEKLLEYFSMKSDSDAILFELFSFNVYLEYILSKIMD